MFFPIFTPPRFSGYWSDHSGWQDVAKPASDIEAEVKDIAVLNDIFGTFEAHLARVLRALLAAIGDEVVIGDGLGADEALLEIGVDHARGLRRLGAVPHRPGMRFFRSDGEEGDEIEQAIAGMDDARETRLAKPQRREIFGFLGLIAELRDLGLDRGGDDDRAGAARGGVFGDALRLRVAGRSARFLDIADIEHGL